MGTDFLEVQKNLTDRNKSKYKRTMPGNFPRHVYLKDQLTEEAGKGIRDQQISAAKPLILFNIEDF